MAEALYRKYRPQVFEEIVGQEPIENTLKNAIDQDKVSHAYLFTGPRGTGKTTTARLLAKALLCQEGPTSQPDGTCEDCRLIARGEHPDVYELDAASRTGVENVREEIIGRVQFAPTRGRTKVYIIDEVHMLSTAAFNALLKTLEEPPSHVVFILCTTDPQKVPETIHSRCQRFDFHRIASEAIVSKLGAICLSEGVEFEGEALDLIARRAEGGMRNALTSLEQLIAFGEGTVTLQAAERMLGSLDSNDLAEIVSLVGRRDVAGCFRWISDYVETGADLAQFTRDFAEHMRSMYLLAVAGEDVPLDIGETQRRELASELPLYGPDRLVRVLGVLRDLSNELKSSTNPRLSFEIAMTRLVRPESDLTLESLAERIEDLERKLASLSLSERSAVMADTRRMVPTEPVAASGQAAPAKQAPMPERTPMSEGQALAQERQAVEPGRQTDAPVEREATPQPSSTASTAADPSHASGSADAARWESFRNPAKLQRVWQSVMTNLKKLKAAYGVLFLNTKAVFSESPAMFTIVFPAENDFAFKAVQKPDVQEALADALRQACGSDVSYRLEQADKQPPAEPQASQQAAPAVEPQSHIPPWEDSPATASHSAIQAQSPTGPTDMTAFGATSDAAPSQRPSAVAPSADPSKAVVPNEVSPGFVEPHSATADALTSHAAVLEDIDEVPLSAYEDIVPYDDGPYDEGGPREFQDEGTSNGPSGAKPDDDTSATADSDAADLNAMLAFGFGEGTVFEEVQ